MSIDVNVQNDLVIVTESSEDIVVNVSNAAGPAGVGVPVGGSTGQVLKKLSATNYDTYWALDAGGVPYSGATGDVDLGEYELKAGQVEFDQTPTGTTGAAVMRWNDSDGTVDLGLKGGNVTLQVGQEQVLRVVNKTGANLLESQYRAVRIRLVSEGGAQGQRLAVVLAQGDNDPDSTTTIGIVTENIDNNQEGFITTSGEVRGINTTGLLQGETWVDGDIIYLSPTIPGGITKVKPTAPQHLLQLGYVIYAHAVNGKIFVKIDNGYELAELHDVYAPSPTDGQGIFWNTANLRYQNNSIAGVLGYTPLSGSGVAGQVAYWSGTNSQTGSNNLFWDAANSRLGIGTNVPAYRLHNVGTSAFDNGNSADAVTILNSGFLRWTSVRFRGFASSFDFQDNAYSTKVSLSMVGSASIFNTGGNFLFGGSTDSGQRLQVYGDAFIKGSGATSATTGLSVQDSAGLSMLRVRNDNRVFINQLAFGNDFPEIFSTVTGSTYDINGASFSFVSSQANYGVASYNYYFRHAYSGRVNTSGTSGGILQNLGFSPTSGTGVFNQVALTGVINQTGGANGITRGLYINPTLTAAADWRSIEWSNNTGWGLYGAGTAPNYVGGNLGIGTTNTGTGSRKLSLSSTASTYMQFINTLGRTVAIGNDTVGSFIVYDDTAAAYRLVVTNSGRLLLGTTTESTFLLDVNGTARVSSSMTILGELTVKTIDIGRGGGDIVSNTRVGVSSLISNTIGVNNTCVGSASLTNATTANDNQAFGRSSLNNITTGSNNTAIGFRAGMYAGSGTGANQTSSNSIYVGWQSRASVDGNTNEIVIGNDVVGGGSNTATLGNTSITKTILRGTINAANLPTSATGLSAGDIWNDAGTLKIV